MTYVFGPVPSRRLGLSLGVDLVPFKTCTYDCLYCQVGRTTEKRMEPGSLVPVGEVEIELRKTLEGITPDIITFSGSGEPTLHTGIGRVIAFAKDLTNTPVAVLTNGSLLWRDEVRERILGANVIVPTLSSVFERTFRAIHNPHESLHLSQIIEGLIHLRREFSGDLLLEVVLLKGYNDSEREIEALKKTIERIQPDKIQLNTVVRPPADSRAISLDRKRLEAIKRFLGKSAEIIADIPPEKRRQLFGSRAATILEMAKRRPVRESDVAGVLGISADETERVLKGLVVKGALRKENHKGEEYYVSSGPGDQGLAQK